MGLSVSPDCHCALGLWVAACAWRQPPLGVCSRMPHGVGSARPEISAHTPAAAPPHAPLFLTEPWSHAAGQHPAFPPLLPAWNAVLSSLRAHGGVLRLAQLGSGSPGQLCGEAARPGAGVCGGHQRGCGLTGSWFGILVTRAELDVGVAAQAPGSSVSLLHVQPSGL